jgi:hypothetical protein
MSRTVRNAGLTATAGLLVLVSFGWSCSTVCRPSADLDSIWSDAVKKGSMLLEVRGTGKLVWGRNPGKLFARVTVPDSIACELELNQRTTLIRARLW